MWRRDVTELPRNLPRRWRMNNHIQTRQNPLVSLTAETTFNVLVSKYWFLIHNSLKGNAFTIPRLKWFVNVYIYENQICHEIIFDINYGRHQRLWQIVMCSFCFNWLYTPEVIYCTPRLMSVCLRRIQISNNVTFVIQVQVCYRAPLSSCSHIYTLSMLIVTWFCVNPQKDGIIMT